ncbi:MAG: hypothetical protein QMD00_03010 [Hadesarchaea archaeon]|nr:hypothetical protein [Hadesarchaea archaeon]
MGSDHKGFFSIDALFAVTLLLLISASFLNMYEGRKQATELMGARLEAKLVGEKLAAAINTVYANGSDFELRVNLPQNVGSYSYQITFDNTARQISVENSAWGAVSVGAVCKNVRNFTLGPENLQTIRVYWADNQVKVVSI